MTLHYFQQTTTTSLNVKHNEEISLLIWSILFLIWFAWRATWWRRSLYRNHLCTRLLHSRDCHYCHCHEHQESWQHPRQGSAHLSFRCGTDWGTCWPCSSSCWLSSGSCASWDRTDPQQFARCLWSQLGKMDSLRHFPLNPETITWVNEGFFI